MKRSLFWGFALLISSASADISWTNASSDRLWLNSQNWSSLSVPDETADVRIEAIADTNGPLISGGQAHCNKLKLRDGDMLITAGTLHVHYWGGAGSWGGTSASLEINGDATITCDDNFLIGYAQQGLLSIKDNASVTIAKELIIGKTDNITAGQGHLQLDGGTLQTGQLEIINDGIMSFGFIDIVAGQLIIDANQFDLVTQYIQQGLITAYENNPDALVQVSCVNDQTIITAEPQDILKASNPTPADGTEDAQANIQLSWSPGFRASKHDLYLGTNKQNLESADTGNPFLYIGRFDANTCQPIDLQLNTTYYWRIDQINSELIIKGDIWQFSISDKVTIDDFETYQDSAGLNSAWLPNSIASASLSVGDPCHSGTQAMIADFNTAEQIPAEVKLTFAEPRNWSRHAYSLLACWLKGDTSNTSKPAYLKITDSTDNSYSITCLDETDVAKDIWSLFTLDLTTLTPAVDISNIISITFGMAAPRSFVSVAIDDIQIFSARCPANHNCRDFDFNCDNQTNFTDFTELAASWFTEYGQPDYKINCDLNQDAAITLPDIELFAGDWLAPDFYDMQRINDLSEWTYWITGPINLPDQIWPLTPETSLTHPIDLSKPTTVILPPADSNDKDSLALWQVTSWLLNKVPHAQMITPDEFSEQYENTNLILLGTLEQNPVIAQILPLVPLDTNDLMSQIVNDGYRITYFQNPLSPSYDVILMLANSRTAAWQTAIILYGAVDRTGPSWQLFNAVYYGNAPDLDHTPRRKSSKKVLADQVFPVGIDMWNYPTISLSTLKRVLEVLKPCQMNTVRFSPSGFQHVADPAACVEKILDIGHAAGLKMVINVGNEKLDHQPHDLTDQHWRTICRIKDHPALLTWLLYDELGSGDSYKDVADQLAWLKKIDPNHPVDTIIASSFINVSETKMEEMVFLKDHGVEIVTMDYYPWGDWVADSNIARWEEKMAAGYEAQIIPWAIIQAHTTVSDAVMPTPEMIRNQTWWCIAGKARGFFYANPCIYNNATNRGFLSLDLRPHQDGRFDEICKLIPMVKKLKNMLIKADLIPPQNPPLNFQPVTGFSQSAAQARFMHETQRDQDYIILINKDLENPVTVEFAIDADSRTQYLSDIVNGSTLSPYQLSSQQAFYSYELLPGEGTCLAILTAAWNPSPCDQATDIVPDTVELSWLNGVFAEKHNLYLTTDRDALEAGNVTPTLINTTSNTYAPSILQPAQTYYWKVDEINETAPNPCQGDIWQFTTK